MHGLEARCQANTKDSASNVTTGDRKPLLPGLLGDDGIPLPGKPMQLIRVSSEGITKVSSSKESDMEGIMSTSAATLDSTDGGHISTTVMASKDEGRDEDEDSEFFDALENSNAAASSSSSSVTIATEKVELLSVKDTDSSVLSTSPKVQSSGVTNTKEDHLPGPECIDRQLNVSLMPCLHGNTLSIFIMYVESSQCY